METNLELEFPIHSISKLLVNNPNIGKIIGSIDGDMIVLLNKLPETITEEAFGSSLGFNVSTYILTGGSIIKQSGFGLSIKTGSQYVDIDISADNWLALSLSIPLEIELDLENFLENKSISGSLSLEIVVSISFIPNYRSIANRSTRKAIQSAIHIIRNKTIRITGTIAQKVIKSAKYGLSAIDNLLIKFLERRAKQFILKQLDVSLFKSIKEVLKPIGQEVLKKSGHAIKSLLRGALRHSGKIAGAGGIYLDVYFSVEKSKNTHFIRIAKRTMAEINERYSSGYATMLSSMTQEHISFPQKHYETLSLNVKRLDGEITDMYELLETLSKNKIIVPPDYSAYKWRKRLEQKGIRFTQNKKADMKDLDPIDMYREAFNIYFVFFDHDTDLAGSKTTQHTARKMIEQSRDLAYQAGSVAAYHDILAFVLVSSSYAISLNDEIDLNVMWEDWNNVAYYHRKLYGKKNERTRIYKKMCSTDETLKPNVIPFI